MTAGPYPEVLLRSCINDSLAAGHITIQAQQKQAMPNTQCHAQHASVAEHECAYLLPDAMYTWLRLTSSAGLLPHSEFPLKPPIVPPLSGTM